MMLRICLNGFKFRFFDKRHFYHQYKIINVNEKRTAKESGFNYENYSNRFFMYNIY